MESSSGRRTSWYLGLIAVCGLAALHGWISSQQSQLADQRDARQRQSENETRQLERLTALKQQVRKLKSQLRAEREYLRSAMSRCRSREEFLVTDGQHIAISVLNDGDHHQVNIGIYLPGGRHQLKYVMYRAESSHSFMKMHTRVAASVIEEVSVDLQGDEVYALRIGGDRNSAPQMMQVALAGKDNETVYQRRFPQLVGWRFHTRRGSRDARVLTLPNEVTLMAFAASQVRQGHAIPVTGVATAMTRGRDGISYAFHFWLQSDAPNCMAAAEVADSFDAIAKFGGRSTAKPTSIIKQLFQPYGGSGRYNFRPGTFRSVDTKPAE